MVVTVAYLGYTCGLRYPWGPYSLYLRAYIYSRSQARVSPSRENRIQLLQRRHHTCYMTIVLIHNMAFGLVCYNHGHLTHERRGVISQGSM